MSPLEADGVIGVADKAVELGVAKPIQLLEAKLELTLQAMAEKQQYSMNTLIILTGAIFLVTFPSSPYFSALLSIIKK
jgi:hypothetical protein